MNKASVSELWARFKWPNIYVIKISEGKRRDQKIFLKKMMAIFFSKLIKTINWQIQEAQQILGIKFLEIGIKLPRYINQIGQNQW